MAPIFIMGYMACGKTTFGRALARALGLQFIDLDFYIEQRYRQTIREIFADRGESGFRELERRMLREAGEFEGVVIACGGGTPCFHDNMDYMLSRGVTVWLETSPGRILERLCANSSRRPLMAGKSREEIACAIEEGLASRGPAYARAEIRFSGEELEDRRQIDRSVADFISRYPTVTAGNN